MARFDITNKTTDLLHIMSRCARHHRRFFLKSMHFSKEEEEEMGKEEEEEEEDKKIFLVKTAAFIQSNMFTKIIF